MRTFIDVRVKLRMMVLINKSLGKFIGQQLCRALQKFDFHQTLNNNNCNKRHQKFIDLPLYMKKPIDWSKTMFVHFTYSTRIQTFL